jgi:hypothetical protein
VGIVQSAEVVVPRAGVFDMVADHVRGAQISRNT